MRLVEELFAKVLLQGALDEVSVVELQKPGRRSFIAVACFWSSGLEHKWRAASVFRPRRVQT